MDVQTVCNIQLYFLQKSCNKKIFVGFAFEKLLTLLIKYQNTNFLINKR